MGEEVDYAIGGRDDRVGQGIRDAAEGAGSGVADGRLGSGKTTLTKGIVAGLGAAAEDEVTSPTFTLVHVYGRGGERLYHGDLYRIESFHDFETLGLEDVFAKPAVMILEWSEKFPLGVALAAGAGAAGACGRGFAADFGGLRFTDQRADSGR